MHEDAVAIAFLVCACMGALVTLAALVLFSLVFRATLHPSQLLVFKFASDLLYLLNKVWHFAAMIGGRSPVGCVPYTLLSRYFLSASQFWGLILSVDLFLALRNPFTAYPEYYPYYHATAWLTEH
jgi:hypothetical protein